MKIEIHQNEVDWLAAREQSLGGSDQAARLLWKGDTHYWLRKNPAALAKHRAEIEEEDEKHWAKSQVDREVRSALEPVIERRLADAREIEIVDPGPYCIMRSEVDPRWHYSPDGLVIPRIITAGEFWGDGVDISTEASYKTVSPYARWKWDDAEPDLYANLQIQSLYAWPDPPDFDPVILAALIGYGEGANDFLTYDVEPNPDLIELIQETTERFWKYVDEDKPPPPDGYDATMRSLNIIYKSRKKGRGATITLGTPWIAKDLEHQRLKREIDDLERQQNRIKQEIAAEMGEQEAGLAMVPADEHQPGRTWQRVQIGPTKPQLCPHCQEVVRKGHTYTKVLPLKG